MSKERVLLIEYDGEPWLDNLARPKGSSSEAGAVEVSTVPRLPLTRELDAKQTEGETLNGFYPHSTAIFPYSLPPTSSEGGR